MKRTSALVAITLAVLGLSGVPAYAEPVEHISNGTFDSGTDPWWATDNAPMSVVDGRLCVAVPGGAANPWDVAIGFNNVPLANGAPYHLTFDASASAAVTVKANVQLNEAPYTTALSRDVALGAEPQHYAYDFTGNLDSANGTLTFQLGGAAEGWTFCLDNVSLTSDDAPPPPTGAEQVENGDFADGMAGWFAYGTTTAAVTDGRLCADVPGGLANPWDAGIGQNDVKLEANTEYTFSFDATAAPGATVRAAVQLGAEPYTTYFSRDVVLAADSPHQEFTFTAPVATEVGQVVFQVGGTAAA